MTIEELKKPCECCGGLIKGHWTGKEIDAIIAAAEERAHQEGREELIKELGITKDFQMVGFKHFIKLARQEGATQRTKEIVEKIRKEIGSHLEDAKQAKHWGSDSDIWEARVDELEYVLSFLKSSLETAQEEKKPTAQEKEK